MNSNERIIAMESVCDALSKACDALIGAKKEYDIARILFSKTISDVTGDRCTEMQQFEAKWKIEWQEKWGCEWGYLPLPEFHSIIDNPQNTGKFIEFQNTVREECKAIEKSIAEGYKKIEQLRAMAYED